MLRHILQGDLHTRHRYWRYQCPVDLLCEDLCDLLVELVCHLHRWCWPAEWRTAVPLALDVSAKPVDKAEPPPASLVPLTMGHALRWHRARPPQARHRSWCHTAHHEPGCRKTTSGRRSPGSGRWRSDHTGPRLIGHAMLVVLGDVSSPLPRCPVSVRVRKAGQDAGQHIAQ